MTGTYKVPTLVLDDGTIVDESAMIIEWAKANPVSPSASSERASA